jgi:type IV pilus biogenesis protein CpaD/CtpE
MSVRVSVFGSDAERTAYSNGSLDIDSSLTGKSVRLEVLAMPARTPHCGYWRHGSKEERYEDI